MHIYKGFSIAIFLFEMIPSKPYKTQEIIGIRAQLEQDMNFLLVT